MALTFCDDGSLSHPSQCGGRGAHEVLAYGPALLTRPSHPPPIHTTPLVQQTKPV